MSATAPARRVLSGMRPTGRLHLGNYYGALKNWVTLQYEYECFFFVADWHMLTTGYDDTTKLPTQIYDVLIDWLAAGLNPGVATLFIQSHVPEHAELHLLLSMITPLGWLERVPSYKDQQEQLKEKDLATYGFLGYPLLQSADILIYRAAFVPVGEDQVAHVEMTREIARRFNHLYGREADFEEKAERAVKSLGGRNSTTYKQLRRKFQESGDTEALERARVLVTSNNRITVADRERLLGFLEGGAVSILPEPHVLLTSAAEGAWPRRPQDVEVIRQHDWHARRAGCRRKEIARHADRSGPGPADRSRRSGKVSRMGSSQDLLRRRDPRVGQRGLSYCRYRLPRLQTARH